MSRSTQVATFIVSFLGGITLFTVLALGTILFWRVLLAVHGAFGWEGVVMYLFAVPGIPLSLSKAWDDADRPVARPPWEQDDPRG